MNEVAPKGQVFVCAACGKRSKDRYGDQKIDRGWDVSCMLNAVLCYEEKSEIGFWIAVKDEDEKLEDEYDEHRKARRRVRE
jgi:hypothetical protein